jgi:hypothetical protein
MFYNFCKSRATHPEYRFRQHKIRKISFLETICFITLSLKVTEIMADKKIKKKVFRRHFILLLRHRFLSVFLVWYMFSSVGKLRAKTFVHSDSALLFDNLYINTGKSIGGSIRPRTVYGLSKVSFFILMFYEQIDVRKGMFALIPSILKVCICTLA